MHALKAVLEEKEKSLKMEASYGVWSAVDSGYRLVRTSVGFTGALSRHSSRWLMYKLRGWTR